MIFFLNIHPQKSFLLFQFGSLTLRHERQFRQFHVRQLNFSYQRVAGRKRSYGVREVPQRLLLSWLLRLTRNGSFAALLREPHGRARPEPAGGDFLGERVLTNDGRVQLAPPELMERATPKPEQYTERR